MSALVQEKQVESRFFQYVFGYRPPIYKPLSYTGGNFGEIFSNCLGDGVVSSYKIYAIAPKPTPIDFSLRYESVCSRPYDQIKFTQDLLGG
ncbi:MAG: hypothetical protein HC857_17430 [Synechococcales cyanobacterium RU_4_20]|nr:hypothetical protein [Synechococcales cyanobacterium RU_4_20]